MNFYRAMDADHATEASKADDAAAAERERRQARLVKVDLHTARIGVVSVTLRNVSAHGVGGRSKAPLLLGERVAFDLPGIGHRTGTVRWVRGEQFGILTEQPIDLQQIATTALPQSPAETVPGFHLRRPPVISTGRPGLKPT